MPLLDDASERPTVVVWGRQPPPVGGVTRSVEGVTRGLRERGCSVRTLDPYHVEAGQLLRLMMTGDGVSFYHASGPSSVVKLLPFLIADRRSKVLLLHAAEGGTTRQVSIPRGFRFAASRFQRIWVTNGMLAGHIRGLARVPVDVASPFTPSSTAVPVDEPGGDEATRFVTFAHNGLGLYNSKLAVRSVERLRESGVEACLTVVTYGARPHAGDWEWLTSAAQENPWLTVTANTDGSPAESFLRAADVLLRLTTTDGDSMVMREALSLGLRVIASDQVPRPRGVELTGLETGEVCQVMKSGGVVSDGAGLGDPIIDEFLQWLDDV